MTAVIVETSGSLYVRRTKGRSDVRNWRNFFQSALHGLVKESKLGRILIYWGHRKLFNFYRAIGVQTNSL